MSEREPPQTVNDTVIERFTKAVEILAPAGWTDTIGRHNANLAQACTRILEGATWKRQRVVGLLPAGKTVPTEVTVSIRNLIAAPNQAFTLQACKGDEVGIAYQRMMDGILEHPELSQWEYVLTIEHDNLAPPDALLNLIKALEEHPEYAAISALYWTKGEGGVPQIWGDVKDPVPNFRPQVPDPPNVVECYGVGMGFVLHRMSMFRELAEKHKDAFPRPWWKTLAGKDGCGTQDLYFWGKARPLGFRCAVDCRVLVGHMDATTGVVW